MKSASLNRLLVLSTVLFSGSALAWFDCANERRIDQSLDIAGSDQLLILAAAGDLEVRGVEGLDEVRIGGTACASSEELLEQLVVETREGATAEIETVVPETDWSLTARRYAYIDLEVEVPASLRLDIKDSSGDLRVERVGEVAITDSSGDIEVEYAAGPVSVQDSSGDMEINDIRSDVTVLADSSGDIRGGDIDGSVIVVRDSSGDIRFHDVGQNFTVERDSSGDIVANGVGGDFLVERDSSGDVRASNVEGDVSIPDRG